MVLNIHSVEQIIHLLLMIELQMEVFWHNQNLVDRTTPDPVLTNTLHMLCTNYCRFKA